MLNQLHFRFVLIFLFLIHNLLSSQGDDLIIEEFDDLIEFEYAKIVTKTALSNFGNYAAVSTTDNSLEASVNFLDGKKIWGLTAGGGATEGVSELFKNGNPNSTFKGSVQLHLLTKIGRVSRSDDKIRLLNDQLKDKKSKFLIALNDLKYKKDSIATITEINKIDNTIRKINSSVGSTPFKVDSLKYELQNSLLLKNNLAHKLTKIRSIGYRDSIETILWDTFDKDSSEIVLKKLNVGLNSFNFGWWTFQYESQQTTFKNLRTLAELEMAIVSDTSYLSHQFTIAYSTFRKNEFSLNDHFTSAGASISLSSNFSDLKKTSLESRSPVLGDSSLVNLSNTTVYEGDFQKSLWQVRLFVDYYKFIQVGETEVAFHFNPTLTFRHDDSIVTSMVIGALFPFKDLATQKTKVNLEVFYKINDAFNSLGVQNALANRNVFGVSATIPIKF